MAERQKDYGLSILIQTRNVRTQVLKILVKCGGQRFRSTIYCSRTFTLLAKQVNAGINELGGCLRKSIRTSMSDFTFNLSVMNDAECEGDFKNFKFHLLSVVKAVPWSSLKTRVSKHSYTVTSLLATCDRLERILIPCRWMDPKFFWKI